MAARQSATRSALADFARLSATGLKKRLKALQSKSGLANESQRLQHELQVHQIELEMQNRELREAQHELEAARNRYADLYDFAPVGYLTLDEKGRVMEINLTGATMLGTERTRVIGVPFVSWLAPGENKAFSSHLRNVFRTKGPAVAELRIHVNGEDLDVRLESAAHRFDGATLCRTAVADISKHKQAEQVLRREHDELEARVQERTLALRQVNETLQAEIAERKRAAKELRLAATVFENTDQAIMILDREGEIVVVNSSFTAITGYSQTEALGKSLRVLRAEQHDDEYWREWWHALRRTGRWRGEVWQRRKDGELFPAWQTIGSVADDQGQVVNYVSILADIKPIKATHARLTHLAHHDALTNLPNRLLLDASLAHAIEVARRHQQKLAILFLDLDRFKGINDTLGHDVGDQLLREIAERLKQTVRAQDTVARLGGDEFVIVAEEVSEQQDAVALALKIIAAVRCPMLLSGREVVTTASIGISLYPDDAQSGAELIKAADAAMYRAKKYRDTYYFYTAD